MPWLVRGDQVLSSLRVADSSSARTRGLVGRDGLEETILLRPARSVHTLNMRLPIDVAHLDYDLTVLRTTRMDGLRVDDRYVEPGPYSRLRRGASNAGA